MSKQMEKEVAITASALAFSYRKESEIIDSLSVSLLTGETVALIGANGAGKTTLGKLLTGILRPTRGTLTLFGQDASKMSLPQIGQKIGYSFQNPEQQLFTTSVEAEIAFGLKHRGMSREEISEKTEALLSLFELQQVRYEFPLNVSWGEKRRIALAACFALNPGYLVLDEPTTGQDEERITILNQALERLRQRDVGMLLISHNESFIEQNAQRILRMERGAIVDDCYC